MSSEKSLAIVLRLIDFSETSSIVTLMTREFGKVSALAKGARRPKGPFDSALDLLSLCRVVFIHKSSDALDLLTEAKLERRFRSASRSLPSLYAGYYVSELLTSLTDDSDPCVELFDAANATLLVLDALGAKFNRDQTMPSTGRPDQVDEFPTLDVASIVLRFEMTLLKQLGHLPSWRHCAGCGKPMGALPPRVPFGMLAGGVLCGACRPGQRQVSAVRREVLEVLHRYSRPIDPPGRDNREGRENRDDNGEIDVEENKPIDKPIDEPATPARIAEASLLGLSGDQQSPMRQFSTLCDGLEPIAPGLRGELRGLVNHFFANLMGRRPRMHQYLGILSH